MTGKFSNTKRMHPSRGFTLVETLVAVSILLLAIVGPMNIAARGMQMGYHANDEMTAVFLAQEAIEAIEKLRDDNALTLLNTVVANDEAWDWYNALPASCKTDGQHCDIDIMDGTFHACGSCLLNIDPTPGRAVYGYGSGTGYNFSEPSVYTRQITLSGAGATAYARPVTVTVSWPSVLFGTKTVTLQTWIYNAYAHYE